MHAEEESAAGGSESAAANGRRVRRGKELRAAVARRRRAHRLALAAQLLSLCAMGALLLREPSVLFAWAFWCALGAVAALALPLLAPRMELRAIRLDVTRPPLSGAGSRRLALIGALVGGIAAAGALALAGFLGSWLSGWAIALPIALLTGVWTVGTLRAAPKGRRG